MYKRNNIVRIKFIIGNNGNTQGSTGLRHGIVLDDSKRSTGVLDYNF